MLMEAMDKKIAENLKNRLDSHDKLWYPVVTARLVRPNQSSSGPSEEMPATLFAEDRFLHSILLFKKESGLWFAPLSLRAAQALWYGDLCKKYKMRDTQT